MEAKGGGHETWVWGPPYPVRPLPPSPPPAQGRPLALQHPPGASWSWCRELFLRPWLMTLHSVNQVPRAASGGRENSTENKGRGAHGEAIWASALVRSMAGCWVEEWAGRALQRLGGGTRGSKLRAAEEGDWPAMFPRSPGQRLDRQGADPPACKPVGMW